MRYSIIIAAALLVGCGQHQESNKFGTTPARKPQAQSQQIPTPPPVPSEDPKPDPTPVPDHQKGLFTRLCEDITYTGPGRDIIDFFIGDDDRNCSGVDKMWRYSDSIYLGDEGISDAYPISEWDRVERFTSMGNPIIDLSFTRRWKNLIRFYLFSDEKVDVSTMKILNSVREFSIIGSPIDLKILVKKIPNVEELSIKVDQVEENNIGLLKPLRHLKTLSFHGSKFGPNDLYKICLLKRIQSLSISSSQLRRVDFLKACGADMNIKQLDLSYNMLESLEGIDSIRKLERLTIFNTFNFLYDITPLHNVWTLKYLEVDGVPRSDKNCPTDKKLPEGVEKFCFN